MNEVSTGVVPDRQDSVSQPRAKSSVFRFLKRWLREPLLHFLVIGVVLFGLYSYVHRGRGGFESSKQIALSLDDLRLMETYFESQWHRQPTPAEFQAMVEDKVKEEVLYREGLAMGLDKDDTIVKRRMAQKMQFLAEDVAAAHEPSTAELKALVRKEQGQVRPAQPLQLPPSLLFSRQAWQECSGRRRKDIGQNRRPAGGLEARRFPRRFLYVSGLLW